MRFLPREEKFFKLFLTQVQIITESAALLLTGVKAGSAQLADSAVRIKDLEKKGDDIIHQVFTHLNETFITPLDPEDIHSLSSRLDDVLDGIEDAAHRLVAYRIDPIPAAALETCNLVVACTDSLSKAFQALNENQPVISYCIEINRLEEQTDELTRAAIRDLFDTERDSIQLLKLKEIYECLEQTTDRCEDVADALQNVVVKNS